MTLNLKALHDAPLHALRSYLAAPPRPTHTANLKRLAVLDVEARTLVAAELARRNAL